MLVKCRRCKKIFKNNELKRSNDEQICPVCGFNLFSVIRLSEASKELKTEKGEITDEASKALEGEGFALEEKIREEELPSL